MKNIKSCTHLHTTIHNASVCTHSILFTYKYLLAIIPTHPHIDTPHSCTHTYTHTHTQTHHTHVHTHTHTTLMHAQIHRNIEKDTQYIHTCTHMYTHSPCTVTPVLFTCTVHVYTHALVYDSICIIP